MESFCESLSSEPVKSAVIPLWHGDVLAERNLRVDQAEEPLSDWNEAMQRIRNMAAKQ